MLSDSEIIVGIRCIAKVYEKMGESMRREYGLTKQEMDIISFLGNNPDKDTASDIVELRRIPKANVSQAVESLIQGGYLKRSQDMYDRRRIHLTLTEKANAMLPKIKEYRCNVLKVLFDGISKEELEVYTKINRHIARNAAAALEK